ncbi:hypothetical protein PCANC_00145 [Puccinia coronata f. sp. avenae]|uniref:Uncharacterized protein n=1 Tax=Puccinia coronata f. sp. avenae TaxID=200324 RepID=A0A2N5W8P1_9BASI|nr:hypothetical protein PCANC_00145 [Puccinia coronata f. sp. avenae]
MRLQVNIDSSELNNRSNKDCAENSSRPIAGSKRRGEELDLPYPPPKSRRLEFMKYRIKMDCKASNFVTQRSAIAYHYYSLGNHLKAVDEYEKFLDGRSWWRNSIREDGKLVIIQSIFNLTRSYLALNKSDKAQIVLQELYDTKKETSIGWGHSLFNELASLHSRIKATSAKQEHTNRPFRGPEILGLERSLKSVQRRSQVMNTNGNPEGAVKIISQILTLLPNEVNQLDKTLKVKDILIELHLNLAEGHHS